MNDVILQMNHITKEFPGVKALDDVTLTAHRGEILSVCGENGAGKSTLMKILSGSYSYDSYSGEILIDGEKMKFVSTGQSEKAGIAMIYQELNMHLDFSVAENLFLGNWKKFGRILDWGKMEKEAEKYIEMVGAEVSPGDILRNVTTSRQQLISIARALARHPRILVLDEPTASLTDAESENLFRLMHRLKDEGYTCILISHKLDEVFEHSDRIVVMRDGKVINEHVRGEFDQNRIIAEMVGRKIDNLYPEKTGTVGETVLKVSDVTVPHPLNRKRNIVEHVSFEVKRGEILGIGGLVGAGRSELAGAIFGSIPRTSGTIEKNGKELRIHTPADAIRNKIALVTEERKQNGYVGGMGIDENITLASLKEIRRHGILSRKMEEEKSMRFFRELSIKANNVHVKVNTLSGGNQQKVVLSKWLMKDPDILILDEPTRGIDVGTKYEIYKIMTQLASRGMAIIMISSELPELLSMSDRILVLAQGHVAGEAAKKDATQEYIMGLATKS